MGSTSAYLSLDRLARCLCVCLLTAALVPVFCLSADARDAGWVPLSKSAKEHKVLKPAPAVTATPAQESATAAVGELPRRKANVTVYDSQPPVTEQEVLDFVTLLPQFRAWTRSNGEEAHPVLNRQGKPDFTYSARAAQWVQSHDFVPERFFCIMGRMAAGMVVVEEGNDFRGTRPRDMPEVSKSELELVRRHMGELLSAGGQPQPLR